MTDPLRSIARDAIRETAQYYFPEAEHRAASCEAACRSVLRAFVTQLKEKTCEVVSDSYDYFREDGRYVRTKDLNQLLAEWDK